jgi:hypothetical protein
MQKTFISDYIKLLETEQHLSIDRHVQCICADILRNIKQLGIKQFSCLPPTVTFHGYEGNNAANDSHNYFYVGFKINKSRYGFGKLLYRKHDNGLPVGLEENNGVIQANPQNLISEPQNKYAYPEKYVGVFIGDKYHGEGIKEFHSNGNVSFAGSKNIGVKQGNCQSYWTNGNLISDKFFNAKGREEGPGTKLWENGNVMSVHTFKNGLEEGPGQEYWDDGTKKTDHF